MNPQVIHENLNSEQLPIPNPIRKETQDSIKDAQKVISTTHCGPQSYNESTENFESARDACKQQSRIDRASLSGQLPQSYNPKSLPKTPNLAGNLQLRGKYGSEVISKGYDNKLNLFGYDSLGQATTMNVYEFEKQIRSGEHINPKMLANYFLYLLHAVGVKYQDIGYFLQNTGLDRINKILANSPDPDIGKIRQDLISQGVFVNGMIVDNNWNTFKEKILPKNIPSLKDLAKMLQEIKKEREENLKDIELYTPEQIREIATKSLGEDISSLTDFPYLEDIIASRVDIIKERFLESIKKIYGDIPAAMNLFTSISSKLGGEAINIQDLISNYQLGEVNLAIRNHNYKYKGSIPEITGNQKKNIITAIENLNTSLRSNVEFEAIMTSLGESQTKMSEIELQLTNARFARTEARKEGLDTASYVEKIQQLETELGISQEEKDSLEAATKDRNEIINSRNKTIKGAQEKMVFDWTTANLNHILGNIPDRIGLLNTKEVLLKFINQYSTQVSKSDISLVSVNMNLRRDVEVITAIGIENINPEELGLLGVDFFYNNTEMVYEFLNSSVAENVLSLLEKSDKGKELCRTQLTRLKNEDPDNTIFSNISYNLITYDREHADGISFSLGISLSKTTGLSYDEISSLKTSEQISEYLNKQGKTLDETLKENASLIDIFFEKNPEKTITLGDETIKPLDFYEKGISLDFFPIIVSQRHNPNIDRNLLKKVLESNNAYVYFVHPDVLGEASILEYYIKNCITDIKELQTLEYANMQRADGSLNIPLVLQSAIWIEEKFGEELRNNPGDIGGKYFSMVQGVLASISEEDWDIIVNNDSLKEMYGILKGFVDFFIVSQGIEKRGQNAVKETSELNITLGFEQTRQFLLDKKIEGDDVEKILKIFEQGVTIGDALAKILGRNNYEGVITEKFVEELKEKIRLDKEKAIEENENTPVAKVDERVKHLFEPRKGKDGKEDFYISGKRISEDFSIFRNENPQIKTIEEAVNLYLQTYNLSPEQAEYHKIKKLILDTKVWNDVRNPDFNLQNILNPPANFGDDFGLNAGSWYVNGKVQEIDYKSIRNKVASEKSSASENNVSGISQRVSPGESGMFILTTTAGNISITKEELSIIQNNPEAEKNLIDTRDALMRSGLGKLWDIRSSIFKSISNVPGVGFNITNDYINKNELKILFNSILKSIDEPKLSSSAYSIDEIVSEMERRNGTTMSGKESQVNTFGETKVEEAFLKRYFPKSSIVFEYEKFDTALKA